LIARARLNRRLRADDEAARRDAEECADLARRGGFTAMLAHALTMLGIVSCRRGEYERGLAYFAEAKDIAAAIGDGLRLATSLNNMAMAETALGKQELAVAHGMEAIALIEKTGNRFTRGEFLDTLALANYRLGNMEVARRYWGDALKIAVEFDDPANIADSLEGLARLSMRTGDPTRAIVLVSAAAALRRGIEAVRPPDWAAEMDELESAAAAKLGAATIEAARRQGAAMSMQDAVRYAVGDAPVDRKNGHSLLTDREVQVARLVADGLTNGEIAQRLRISERTVDAHLEHIRNKLGLRTRAQIAVWAHERVGTA
jgi:DNA-binding CsgD family transcriptional regulator/tetratricopeptide (TPR) repeat protein